MLWADPLRRKAAPPGIRRRVHRPFVGDQLARSHSKSVHFRTSPAARQSALTHPPPLLPLPGGGHGGQLTRNLKKTGVRLWTDIRSGELGWGSRRTSAIRAPMVHHTRYSAGMTLTRLVLLVMAVIVVIVVARTVFGRRR